jgi:hypothetical protein
VTLLDVYRRLAPAVQVTPERAAQILAEAKPHAAFLLGGGVDLPVRAALRTAETAHGGSLIPAWPQRDRDGSVTIEYVEDWGALLAGWVSSVQPAEQDLAVELVTSGQRVWIGIANDVLQLFVPDPPEGSYSMVRHHALMLVSATLWLGTDAVRRWRVAHASSASAFLERHADEPLWTAIDTAEHGLADVLRDPRCRQAAPRALVWLDTDESARQPYVDYLGAASLGVLAVLDVLEDSHMAASVWLQCAVSEWHADAEFNRAWIETCARWLGPPVVGGAAWPRPRRPARGQN